MNRNLRADSEHIQNSVNGGGRQVIVTGKIISNPWIVEMINHFSTKEHKRRFVKNKHRTECQLQGGHACLLYNVFLKCMPHHKQSTCKWREMKRH